MQTDNKYSELPYDANSYAQGRVIVRLGLLRDLPQLPYMQVYS
jgi:hypothetical protein